jgi:hypothetical protein
VRESEACRPLLVHPDVESRKISLDAAEKGEWPSIRKRPIFAVRVNAGFESHGQSPDVNGIGYWHAAFEEVTK